MNMMITAILVYLSVLLWISFKGGSKAKDLSSFLTGGRQAGVLLCALSLVSTIIGGSATIGIGALAKTKGAAAFWWLGVGAIGLFFHGLFIAPKIRALPCITLPEVAGHFSGKWAERWSGGIIAISWIAVTAAQFTALRTLLFSLAPKETAEILYILIAAAVLIHTTAGGQGAVIRTDALQSLFLLGGFGAAAIWIFNAFPEKVAAADFVPFNSEFGAADLLKLMLLVGITYIIGPDMFSRSFSAKDEKTAAHAAWTAAPLLAVFGAAITFLAVMNAEDPQPVAGWLAETSGLPYAIKGAIALGLISALCGSADTVLLSASGIIERNLIGGNSTKAVKILTALFGTGAALTVYFSGNIIGMLLTAYAFFVPGVAAPMLVTLLFKEPKAHHGLWLTGAVLGGIGGLLDNLLTNSSFTIIGIIIASLFAIAASVKAENPAIDLTDTGKQIPINK